MADALALGASESNLMGVQVSPSAQNILMHIFALDLKVAGLTSPRRGREIFQQKNTCDQVSPSAQMYKLLYFTS